MSYLKNDHELHLHKSRKIFLEQLPTQIMDKLFPYLDCSTLDALGNFKELQYLQDDKSPYWRIAYGKKFSNHLPTGNIKDSYILNCLLVNSCKNNKDLLYQSCKHNWEQTGRHLIDKVTREKTRLSIDKVSLVFIKRGLGTSHDLLKLLLPYFDVHQKTSILHY